MAAAKEEVPELELDSDDEFEYSFSDRADYSKAFIYRINNTNDEKDEYVGGTAQTKELRMKGHHWDIFKRQITSKFAKRVREVGWESWEMKLLENYPCNDKDELRMREQWWIDQRKPNLNTAKAYTTTAEKVETHRKNQELFRQRHPEQCKQMIRDWYKDHREEVLEDKKLYYQENKKEILDKAKERYENNKEEILARQREHNRNNKGKIAERDRKYREENAAKIATRKQEKKECFICKAMIARDGQAWHRKSKNCQELAKKIVNCDLCGDQMTKGELRTHRDSDECKEASEQIIDCGDCGTEMMAKDWPTKHKDSKECRDKAPEYQKRYNEEIDCKECGMKTTKGKFDDHVITAEHFLEMHKRINREELEKLTREAEERYQRFKINGSQTLDLLFGDTPVKEPIKQGSEECREKPKISDDELLEYLCGGT